ncbi:tetratricopeptide repeat protein [Candidatus Nitronereus thalassa]|uniref:Tetratricopeptide repeat protein n=1 Tax=Candidatus Nitronereus thalassa TaxID=3020898 RepID=A0ABU3KBH1_9BACT|nr:tetratricopeptide repeat protein [Candidatus Nitronereus thalassa]MDT7043673.1 tetratricopeptide repeat protein [Candidatus Nitronereus thalassa]
MKQNRKLLFLLFVLLFDAILTPLFPAHSGALQDQPTKNVTKLMVEAEALLNQFQFQATLNHLDKAIQLFPKSPDLHKKRGDVLMILRQNQESLSAYRQALTLAPDFLEGHWALWALLDRLSRNPEEALQTLIQIAALDAQNPLIQLRVARKLRELRRFEESVTYFQRAVNIEPDHSAYRLYLARALFDIRKSKAALQELEWVLSHTSPNSPVGVAAQNLSQTLHGGTVDMGSRTDFFETTKNRHGEKGKDYKSWALTRERAWQFMKAGNFSEADATWRKVLTLDPEDDLAQYNLGLTLLELEKYEDAIASLQASFQKSKQPPFYPDAIFQLGQAYTKLGNWEKAIFHYQKVLDMQELKEQDFYALNFPDLKRVEAALSAARTHVTDIVQLPIITEAPPTSFQKESPREETSTPSFVPNLSQDLSEKGQTPLRVRPLSVDVVRGWFRQLLTAKAVGQDEMQAGFHEYIPLNPGDTFPPFQPRIYLVFSLTTPPAGAKQISTQWVAEQVEQEPPNTVIGTDTVLVDVNDSSGYFYLDQPEGGWPVGTYRIDLFVGEEISPYTYVADVRFRIESPNN